MALLQDETLVHCSLQHLQGPIFRVPVIVDGGCQMSFVATRPHVFEFLARMSSRFELILFTTASRSYANEVTDQLDQQHVIQYRLYREHCLEVEGRFIKELSILGRDLSKTIVIDNNPASFAYQVSDSSFFTLYTRGSR